MKDETKAGILFGAFMAFILAGDSIAQTNKLAGVIIIITAIISFIGILYASWQVEQREKRNKRSREIYCDAIKRSAEQSATKGR